MVLGEIRSTTEPSGRVAFTLAADRRKGPRTFRGRLLAAEAVAVLHDLAKAARRRKLPVEQIILGVGR